MTDEIGNTIAQYDGMLPHGFTYSGHPTACAVGLKNIEILERDNLVQHAVEMGEVLRQGFEYLEGKYSFFTKGRNVGLLGGFDLMRSPEENIPFEESVKAAVTLVDECFQRNLLIRPFDFEPGMNIVAVAPPLIIEKDEVEKIIAIIDDSLKALSNKI